MNCTSVVNTVFDVWGVLALSDIILFSFLVALLQSSKSHSFPSPPQCHQVVCKVRAEWCHCIIILWFMSVLCCLCFVYISCVCTVKEGVHVSVCVSLSVFLSIFVCMPWLLSVCPIMFTSGSLTQSTSMSHVEGAGRTWGKKPFRYAFSSAPSCYLLVPYLLCIQFSFHANV